MHFTMFVGASLLCCCCCCACCCVSCTCPQYEAASAHSFACVDPARAKARQMVQLQGSAVQQAAHILVDCALCIELTHGMQWAAKNIICCCIPAGLMLSMVNHAIISTSRGAALSQAGGLPAVGYLQCCVITCSAA